MEAIILQTRQDVALARPGVRPYVVQSGSGAYFPVMALIEERAVQVLGEAFTAAGHIVTFRILRASAIVQALENVPLENPEPIYHTMTLGPEMFAAVFNDYNNWQLAWWREVVQNSVDAGARNITLGTRTNDDRTVTVWCDDDGSGMDQDTMIRKFLAFSGTTKTLTSGTAGGFGEAKKLLILPWISWKIHTRSVLSEGAGTMSKTIETTERRGTRIEVVMSADKCTTSVLALEFLARCNLPHVRFTVEGDNPPDTTIYPKAVQTSLAGGNVIETIEGKAEVYFLPKKNETQSYMYIRTHGLYMFQRRVSEMPGYLIVELTAPSIEVLTANRDGLRDERLESALSQLAERIAIDKMSALKSKKGFFKKKYEGTGKFEARARAAMALEQIGPVAKGPLPSETLGAVLGMIQAIGRGQEATVQAMSPPAVAEVTLDQKFLGPDHLEAALKQLVWQPDFFLVNDIEGFKVPKKFFPETMTPTVLKLAKVWVELNRYVLMQLGSSRRFGVGFIFSESTAAEARTSSEDKYSRWGREDEVWIMLNPFKDFYERKEIWRTSDADLKWLYAAAIHECTHIADNVQWHDEVFASALTHNMAKCADGYRKIRAIAAGIKMRGAPELTPELTSPERVVAPDLLSDAEQWILRLAVRGENGADVSMPEDRQTVRSLADRGLVTAVDMGSTDYGEPVLRVRATSLGQKTFEALEGPTQPTQPTQPKRGAGLADFTEDERDLFRRIAYRDRTGRTMYIRLDEADRASILASSGLIILEGPSSEQYAKLTGKGKEAAVEVTG